MKEIRHTIQSLSYRELEIMEDFITGVPAEEILEEVNQVWDKMEE